MSFAKPIATTLTSNGPDSSSPKWKLPCASE